MANNVEGLKELREEYKSLLRIIDIEVSRTFDAEIKQIDHIVDISKFFISLSATAIFAVFGLPTIVSRNPLLIVSSIVLVLATISLGLSMKKRKRSVEWYTDKYPKERLKEYGVVFKRK